MRILIFILFVLISVSCKKDEVPAEPLENKINEDLSSYQEIASVGLGGAGAAEITTFDPVSKRLFAVNNGTVNKIDVIDLANPSAVSVGSSISMLPYGGFVNSVDAYNGKLAAAIESTNKQSNGKVVVFNTSTLAEIKSVEVGALPDMVTFTKDGQYILTANEGEPNDAYTVDPEGSVSIIRVSDYTVRTVNFSALESQLATLATKGFRIYGPGKNFTKDIEPEYITISDDSKTAWITLQENNAIAELDIVSASFRKIMPLGFKNHGTAGNEIDPSDRDTKIQFTTPYSNVFGMYQPDAIAQLSVNGTPYLLTANEGDAREYAGFNEMRRVGSSLYVLDAAKFTNAASLKTDAQLGRLNSTITLGDTDGDGDFDGIYSLGARSFSIWNALTGEQVYDSKNELDRKAAEIQVYDDARSDDKGTEPEAVTIGRVGNKLIAIIGLERADAFAIYDVTNPISPLFVKMYKTGDAPEGILFIPASKSPIQQSLIVVSSENDGLVKIYKANKL
jgi:DNA-binding beta-propeller fold protein YncE